MVMSVGGSEMQQETVKLLLSSFYLQLQGYLRQTAQQDNVRHTSKLAQACVCGVHSHAPPFGS
jgi:hypothetical protein